MTGLKDEASPSTLEIGCTEAALTEAAWAPSLNELDLVPHEPKGNVKSLRTLIQPPRNPKPPGHTLTGSSSCLVEHLCLFSIRQVSPYPNTWSSKGKLNPSDRTAIKEQWSSEGTEWKIEKINQKALIEMGITEKKKKSWALKKHVLFCQHFAGSYSSFSSEARCLSRATEELWKAPAALAQILEVKVIWIMGLKIINQGVKQSDLKVTHNYQRAQKLKSWETQCSMRC